ncbi:M28 family peptidase [Parvularcula flava]|uniref:Aminopeptidase n=1 Tax=Aquisalinus luteolus TaxID=1566827 RepID=A0A8J3A5Z2_9PROT|nr:M28 family metallopeptidase [Aquisalinus luteolus]NHK29085.1 M28 family peptidase [Aquisalinus luteolus]GGI00358.1 aminopeptidase [Aquisalinus luteolus]
MAFSDFLSRAAALTATGLLLVACQIDEAGTSAISTAAEEPAASADILQDHIAWLSDDARQGREAGTPGYQAAAEYVAAEMEELGLEPAGEDGSWYQQVPLLSVTRDLDAQAMSITRDGETMALDPMEDFLIGASAKRAEAEVTAEAVFVGYGLVAPEFGINDFEGVDVEGKIVVAFGAIPTGLPSEEAAHYSSSKQVIAEELGAVGYITLSTASYEARRPWDRTIAAAGSPAMTWVEKSGEGFTDTPGLVVTGRLSVQGAEKLFEGAEMSFAEISAAEEAGENVASFALPGTITMAGASTYETVTSPNVAGMIRGSDPTLADEYVILTAHLDHTGVRESDDPEEDVINNGALDNATGIAVMLEEARLFKQAEANGNSPRRSVIFLAVTAEEKGLLGSEYYAFNPTVPLDDIVANVNLDMPIITYDFIDVIAFGADHSSLGETVRRAASSMDVELIPDPVPQMSIFTRSDHYRFVQQGVPSVFLFLGFGNGGEEEFGKFMSTHYHRPSDDISQPLDYDVGAKFATLNYRIAREIADADERPTWNEGDFFGDKFGRD